MAERAPAPAPQIVAAIVEPSPSWTRTPRDSGALPVTKIVTLTLFVSALMGFIVIAIFVAFSFYRRFWMAQGVHGRSSPSQNEEAAVRRDIPFLEGFIVANPCGSEQVAYKMDKSTNDMEMTEIDLKGESEGAHCVVDIRETPQGASLPPATAAQTRDHPPS